MALTPRRWIAVVLVAMLGTLAAVLPPGSARGFVRYLPWGWYAGTRREGDSLVIRHNRLLSQAMFAGDQLVLATIRDSVLAQTLLIRRASHGGPQLFRLQLGPVSRADGVARTGGSASASRLRSIQVSLDSSWRELPRRDTLAWTLIALAEPPLRLRASGHDVSLVLPHDGEPILHGAPVGGGCVLVADAGRMARPVAEQRLLDRAAPCRWRAAFGPPGESIGAWLERQEWVSAFPVRSWSYRWGEVQVASIRRARVLADTGAWGDSASALVEWASWWGAANVAACYRGREESCLRVFLDPERWGRQASSSLADAPFPAIRAGRVAGGLLLAGLLDDVLATVGPERFHAFWTSELPPDSALAVALQQPLQPWLMARVERRLGGFDSRSTLPLGSAAMSLVLAGLLAGSAVLGISRRRLS